MHYEVMHYENFDCSYKEEVVRDIKGRVLFEREVHACISTEDKGRSIDIGCVKCRWMHAPSSTVLFYFKLLW